MCLFLKWVVVTAFFGAECKNRTVCLLVVFLKKCVMSGGGLCFSFAQGCFFGVTLKNSRVDFSTNSRPNFRRTQCFLNLVWVLYGDMKWFRNSKCVLSKVRKRWEILKNLDEICPKLLFEHSTEANCQKFWVLAKLNRVFEEFKLIFCKKEF